jgi:hypothetical protein
MSERRQRTDNDREEYETLFILFSEKMEKLMIRLLACFLIALIVAQGLLQITAVRVVLSRVDSLEGVPYRFQDDRPASQPDRNHD